MTLGSFPAFSQAADLEEIARGNLLANPWFAPSGKGIRQWTEHPENSPLIRASGGKEGLAMDSGAAALSVTSRSVLVEPGQAYTLAFDLKQEAIHIGFGMGRG